MIRIRGREMTISKPTGTELLALALVVIGRVALMLVIPRIAGLVYDKWPWRH